MFQSWADIEKHWTAIKFACGLQQDSSEIVDYVCKRFSEMWLHMMRTRGIYNVSELSLGPLIELSQEMREKKIDPLQTEHFSFITDIPLKRRSKLYVFGPNYCGRSDHCTVVQYINYSIKDPLPTCSVIIDNSHLKPYKIWEAVSNIGQIITDLLILNKKIRGRRFE